MPHRARNDSHLYEGHPKLHTRDDRAIAIGRQKIEHPKDRRKSKNHSYPDYHRRDWRAHIEFRRHRGGRPLNLGDDEKATYGADYGKDEQFHEGDMEELRRRAGKVGFTLWDVAKPGKIGRERHRGFEMILRPAEVIALDDTDEEFDDDFEMVERMPTTRKGGKPEKTFAQVVQKRRKNR